MVPPWYQENQHFIGRTNLLKTLRDKLCHEKPQEFNHRVALFGMGGVGGIPAQGLEVEVLDRQTAADMLLLRANCAEASQYGNQFRSSKDR